MTLTLEGALTFSERHRDLGALSSVFSLGVGTRRRSRPLSRSGMAGLLVPRGCRSEPVLVGVTEMMRQGLAPEKPGLGAKPSPSGACARLACTPA